MGEVLVDSEEIVFNLIEEYLNKNRTFNIKRILPYINSRFVRLSININNEDIQKVLKLLVEKKMVIEGTKLTKKEILVCSRRKKIYDYIKENPGRRVNIISKELNISNSIVFWHLSLLLKFQFIKKIIIDNQATYFNSYKK